MKNLIEKISNIWKSIKEVFKKKPLKNNYEFDYEFEVNMIKDDLSNNPYVLEYENTSDKDTTAVLFGFNDYNGVENFGNPKEVVITSLQGGTYRRLLNQSSNKPFVIGEWKFVSSNPKQLFQNLTENIVDANGLVAQKPFSLIDCKDIYQYSADTVISKWSKIIDGNCFFTFTLKANTKPTPLITENT